MRRMIAAGLALAVSSWTSGALATDTTCVWRSLPQEVTANLDAASDEGGLKDDASISALLPEEAYVGSFTQCGGRPGKVEQGVEAFILYLWERGAGRKLAEIGGIEEAKLGEAFDRLDPSDQRAVEEAASAGQMSPQQEDGFARVMLDFVAAAGLPSATDAERDAILEPSGVYLMARALRLRADRAY